MLSQYFNSNNNCDLCKFVFIYIYIHTHKKAHVRAVFILHSLCKLQMILLLFCCSEVSSFSMFLVPCMTLDMWQWHLSEGGLVSRTVCDFQSGWVQRHPHTVLGLWGSTLCVWVCSPRNWSVHETDPRFSEE